MFQVGDIVKVKPEWRNPGESARERYVVADVNDVTKRCGIRAINTTAAFPCVETVGWEMIEPVAEHRLVYTVQFHRRDGKPLEEYEYYDKDAAVEHFEKFRKDDSGLYARINLTETRIGLPEVVLDSIVPEYVQSVDEQIASVEGTMVSDEKACTRDEGREIG